MQHGKAKADWDRDTQEAFQKIRHKLLDKAGDIERLPKTIAYNGVQCNDGGITRIEDIVELMDQALS